MDTIVTMNKLEFCKEYNLTENQFCGKELIPGDLWLSSLTNIPEGFNPAVGGDLDLNSLKTIPEGFNPVVGGYLSLYSLETIPEGFNPVVGGNFWLDSLTSIPEGFNPVVGGDLWLSSLQNIPKGFNPVVGGDLYLSSLQFIPEGFNPTCNKINSFLNLSFTKIPDNCLIYYRDKTYIRSDGIFLELVKKKGGVYKCKYINGEFYIYIVTDGNGKFAHGESIGEARESLKYKVTNRDKSRYKGLGVRSKLKFGEMVECYRVITGACEYGVREFLNRKRVKEGEYSIGEVIKLTYKEYGGKEFREFFSNRV